MRSDDLEMVLRLVTALFAGAPTGFERSYHLVLCKDY
jgi:hypothetical protein